VEGGWGSVVRELLPVNRPSAWGKSEEDNRERAKKTKGENERREQRVRTSEETGRGWEGRERESLLCPVPILTLLR